jgi:hypothetical protein
MVINIRKDGTVIEDMGSITVSPTGQFIALYTLIKGVAERVEKEKTDSMGKQAS